VKRETVRQKLRPRSKKRWLLPTAAATAGIVAVGLFLFVKLNTVEPPSKPEQAGSQATGRFSPGRPVTGPDLQILRWEEMNQVVAVLGTDASEIERLTRLAGDVGTSPAIYLQALLLISRQHPEQALAAFGALDPQTIPPGFLYAPHRLHQALRPKDSDPYLPALRKAVAEGKVPALIQARVQARDGDLSQALTSYLRTDPANWASYDLESFRRIANHQGLAADLAKLIGGALASGRVKPKLTPALQRIARTSSTQPDVEIFKRQLRRAIEDKTPEGTVAIESARKLLRDRKMFLGRDYTGLIDSHREAEPITLSTETVLLLFLAAVDLKEQMEMDRWGQELKRRHRQPEVGDWVNEMTASAR